MLYLKIMIKVTHVGVNIIRRHLILYIDDENLIIIMMMKMINNDNYNFEEGKFLYQKAQKKFQDTGENRTHDPPSSSSDALTTELPSGRNLIITTPGMQDCIGELLEIGRPP